MNYWTQCRQPIRGFALLTATCMTLSANVAFAQGGGTAQLPLQPPSVIDRSLPLGPADGHQQLHLGISMPVPHSAAFEAYAQSVNDPSSRLYRHFLTPQQVGQQFGQPAANVQRVLTYLRSRGFNITLNAGNRLNILADCTVAQAEVAFGTTIENFHALDPNEPGRQDFYSFETPLQVPAPLAPLFLNIAGLQNFTKPHPRLSRTMKVAFARQSAGQTLTPTQTRTLYNTAPMYQSGFTGLGRAVGITSFDGYRLSNLPLWYSQYSLPTPAGGVGSNVQIVVIDGGTGTGTPGGEGDLDIQMTLGQAPLANLVIYDGGGPLVDTLTKEANDNAVDVVTESYGFALSNQEAIACHNLHVQMSAQGITYMAATGDNGTQIEPFAYSDYDPDVLQIGGTVATVDAAGHRTAEVGWDGSGGGWTTEAVPFNVRPSWLVVRGVPANINFRLLPDAALHAAGSGGAYFFYVDGSLTTGDGTSFSSPVFAGSLAIVEQKMISLGTLPPNGVGKRRLGKVQVAIYGQNGRADVWHDITSGSNGTLPNGQQSVAGPGWDFVTGWGSTNFTNFATSLGQTTTPVVYPPVAVSVVAGTHISGNVASLVSPDGNNYVVHASGSTLGPQAGIQVDFNLDHGASAYGSLGFTLKEGAASLSTIQVFAYNWNSGNFDLIRSFAGQAASLVVTAALPNLGSYVDGGNHVRLVVRTYVPNRFHPAAFNQSVDQLVLSGIVSQ